MLYDRPVHELLGECTHSLDEPFSSAQIIAWFHEHYPDVKETTLRVHISGLTAGSHSAPSASQFARHTPVLERVGHRLYRAFSESHSASSSEPAVQQRFPAPTPVQTATRVLLLGCVKTKLAHPAPAAQLYVSPLFRRRLAYAEAAGTPWYVVSGRWGLLRPDELAAPYDLHLGDTPTSYRRAWGSWVTEQLAAAHPLDGLVVEIHAGDVYVDALRAPLSKYGARVKDPVDASSLGGTLTWYDTRVPVGQERGLENGTSPSGERANQTQTSVDRVLAHLSDPSNAVTIDDVRTLPRERIDGAGLYSWWVGGDGAADLSAALGHQVHPGLLYAGQAGATRWPSGTPSGNSVRGRILTMHAGGRQRGSTLRRTLAAALDLDDSPLGEAALTAWMHRHLRVVPLGGLNPHDLGALEKAVLERLDPPFNLRDVPATPVRTALRTRRS